MPHILFQSIPRLLLPKLRWTWWSHHCPSKTLKKSASLWQWAPCTQQGVCDSWATLLAAAQPMLMSHKQPQRACRMWSVQSMFKRKAPLALWKVQWSYRFLQSLDAIYQTSSKLRKSAEATVGWCSVGQMYIYIYVGPRFRFTPEIQIFQNMKQQTQVLQNILVARLARQLRPWLLVLLRLWPKPEQRLIIQWKTTPRDTGPHEATRWSLEQTLKDTEQNKQSILHYTILNI